MEELYFIGILVIAYFVGAIVANGAAFSITERPVINIKPFNCLPCLSHWFTFGLNAGLGGLAYAAVYSTFDVPNVVGLLILFSAFLSGLISFFYNKSKFKVYE